MRNCVHGRAVARAMGLTAATVATLLAGTAAVAQQAPAAKDSTIRMSQLGFERAGPKIATIVDPATRPLPWRVVDAGGKTVASGNTEVFGRDAASGDHVHIARFQSLQAEGTGYRLIVGAQQSRAFAIAERPYARLKYDALSYFYHNRAGEPLLPAYVARPDLARPAGNPKEIAACFAGKDMAGTTWPGCGYRLDVTGGWYDAGDFGKYVVNGGIAAWTLLNAYERAEALKSPGRAAFADGRVRIPENRNGVNDLLDEARHEVEFMLEMQIPDGQTAEVPVGPSKPGAPVTLTKIDAGGMVHHKVHGAHWTAFPSRPGDDTQPRFLYPPSTAATLNLAAVGAQSARIWRTIDPAFATVCFDAAQRAFKAALHHRDIYTTGSFDGGGAYGDTDVSDEFYWATAELFTTTGNPAYLTALRTSSYALGGPTSGKSATGDPNFANTAALGSITLATVPNKLPPEDLAKVRANLTAAAADYLRQAGTQGYGVPRTGDNYDWGSNSGLLNRAMILALAFDFTGDWNYRNGVLQVLDYVLGRNPMDRSYVTGEGERPALNPHHRAWAVSLNPAYPAPPPGAIVGGPNSTAMVDPVAKTMQGTCTGQTCWRDDAGAYALNEVAINWNAPLFWVAAFIDDR